MKKVNLELIINAKMTDENGKLMAPFSFTGSYLDINYDDALDVQESAMQMLSEHGARMLAKGRKHAADMAK